AGVAPREDKQTLGLEIGRPNEAILEEEATINTKVSKEQLAGNAKQHRLPPELRSAPCFLVPLPGGSGSAETWSIGRASAHSLVLRHPSVSKQHAQLQAGVSYCLRDLGSRNGTFVNGIPISGPHWLEDGDSLKLGAVQMWFVKAKTLWRAFHG
ncbi:MAG TPA: FHA domain-containing protein, partial [Polyangiales bacterium]